MSERPGGPGLANVPPPLCPNGHPMRLGAQFCATCGIASGGAANPNQLPPLASPTPVLPPVETGLGPPRPARTSGTKSRNWLIAGLVVALVAAGVVITVLVSSGNVVVTVNSGQPSQSTVPTGEVSQSDVESQVASQLAAETSQPTPKVSCPSGLEAKVGAAIDCTLTPKGSTTTLPVHVTVTSVDNGTAHFSAQVGQAAGAGDKTAFCNDNAILDKATSAAQQPSDLIAIFKANQSTITDFQAKAPSEIVDSAGPLAIAANNAITSGDATAFTTKAIMADGKAVDAYCGQNSDGSPVTTGSTTTTTGP